MDLNELLSYKPTKRAGEKRPLEGKGGLAPPSKSSRTTGGSSRTPAAASDGMYPLATSSQDSASDLNGISDEEKLRLLQSIDEEEEEDLGEWVGFQM